MDNGMFLNIIRYCFGNGLRYDDGNYIIDRNYSEEQAETIISHKKHGVIARWTENNPKSRKEAYDNANANIVYMLLSSGIKAAIDFNISRTKPPTQ
jgi:hypothetical protein